MPYFLQRFTLGKENEFRFGSFLPKIDIGAFLE